jgi:hypothetical protein
MSELRASCGLPLRPQPGEHPFPRQPLIDERLNVSANPVQVVDVQAWRRFQFPIHSREDEPTMEARRSFEHALVLVAHRQLTQLGADGAHLERTRIHHRHRVAGTRDASASAAGRSLRLGMAVTLRAFRVVITPFVSRCVAGGLQWGSARVFGEWSAGLLIEGGSGFSCRGVDRRPESSTGSWNEDA